MILKQNYKLEFIRTVINRKPMTEVVKRVEGKKNDVL